MSIFTSTASQRGLYRGYGDWGGSQRRADHFSARLSSRMGRWGTLASEKTIELTSDFEDAGFEDTMEKQNESAIEQAEKLSTSAAASVEKASKVTSSLSESGYVKRTMQRRQALQKAMKDLEKAEEFYKATGSNFKFNYTGYTPLQEDADEFYNKFDESIEMRKQEYAEMYGADSFDDLFEGYGQQVEGDVIGQRDVMDMVMSDITGMSYEDLAALNLYNVRNRATGQTDEYGWGIYRPDFENAKDYTGEQMSALREFYATSQLSAIRNANKRAAAEEEFRRKTAEGSTMAAVSSQKKRSKEASQRLGESREGIQMELRELDENFMKNIGQFRSSPKKRKVPKISFVEGRPL